MSTIERLLRWLGQMPAGADTPTERARERVEVVNAQRRLRLLESTWAAVRSGAVDDEEIRRRLAAIRSERDVIARDPRPRGEGDAHA